jgi:predicted amidohydrolase
MVNISQIRQTYSYDPSGFAKSYDAFRKTILNNEDKDTDVTTIRGKILQQGRSIKVASVQLETTSGKDTGDEVENDAASFFNRAVEAVHDAVTNHNANLVLLQELFLGPYFCQSQEASLFSLAENIDEGNPIILKLQSLAKSLNVVLPISIFERKNNTFYNTVIMIDSDGSNLGKYREYLPPTKLAAL